MTNLETEILYYIKNNHFSKGNAIHFKDLAVKLDLNEREVRLCVAELVTHYEQPIAGTDAGYYFIASQEEYDHASNELMSRIRKLSQRHKGLRNGYLISKQETKPKQLQLV